MNSTLWTTSAYSQSSFINTTFLRSNVWFSGSKLVIRSDVNNTTGGELKSRSLYTYGSYRASMKINQTPGTYVNFFNYMPPGGNKGEKHNEIDVEVFTNETGSYALLSTWFDGRRNWQLCKLSFDPAEAYHVYGYDWYTSHVDFYIDDVLVWISADMIPCQPTYVYFNSWVVEDAPPDHGSGINTQFVDWVTVVPVDPSRPKPTVTPTPSTVPTVTPTPQKTITVGKTGDYKTIQAAIAAASPGAVVLVSNGTYREPLAIDRAITVKAASGSHPVIDIGGNMTAGVTITAAGARLEGFDIKNTDQSYSSVMVGADRCTVAGNVITGGYAGICAKFSCSTIQGNTVSGCKLAGIYAYSTGSVIEGNEVSASSYGVLAYGASGFLITGNNLHGNRFGIRLDSSVNNSIFLNDLTGNTYPAAQSDNRNNWVSSAVNYQYGGKKYNGKLGNRFGDYGGKDLNFDGIGDTPCYSSYGVTDVAPLMQARTSYRIV